MTSLSTGDLARLAFSVQCRELSDLGRAFAVTYADSYGRGGELTDEAERLVAAAEYARVLAITAERARGVSWETIGENLRPDARQSAEKRSGDPDGVSKQAARKRFGEAVDEVLEGILFPLREGGPGQLGWWACPDGLDDPQRTIRDLDAWADRHREPTDPGKDVVGLVSAGLGDPRYRALDLMDRVLKLSQRLVDHGDFGSGPDLPQGVSERAARRLLLEARIELYGLQMPTERDRVRKAELVTLYDRDVDDLRQWHRDDLADRLAANEQDADRVVITLDNRPVAAVERHQPPGDDAQEAGWFLWGVEADGSTDASSAPQLVAEVQAFAASAGAAAAEHVTWHIASDLVKGVGPFDIGGIAGPPST